MKAALMGNTFSAEQDLPIIDHGWLAILPRDCSKESGV
jgi:hypothetical protein